MKKSQYLFAGLTLGILLFVAGCSSTPLAEQPSGTPIADADVASTPKICNTAIDISENSDNKSGYDTATFTIPCDWTNSSSSSVLKITSADKNVTLTYPSGMEGGLPEGGVEKVLNIMGKKHTRYVVQVTDKLVMELIKGPITDSLGVRPTYTYPTGSAAGETIAKVFESMKLEIKNQTNILEAYSVANNIPYMKAKAELEKVMGKLTDPKNKDVRITGGETYASGSGEKFDEAFQFIKSHPADDPRNHKLKVENVSFILGLKVKAKGLEDWIVFAFDKDDNIIGMAD